MASLNWEGDTARIQWRDKTGLRVMRPGIRLPGVTEKQAEVYKVKITALETALNYGVLPDGETQRWVEQLPDNIADELADKRLIQRRVASTLKAVFDRVIDSAKVEPGMKTNLRQTSAKLCDFFGPDTPLRDITEARAQEWVDEMNDEGLAGDTVYKHAKRAQGLYKKAKKLCGLANENPFGDLELPRTRRGDKIEFTRAMTDKLLAQAEREDDLELRDLLAYVRYAGVRCSSEVFNLRWIDVDFDLEGDGSRAKITIHDQKNQRHEGRAVREIPLFPELRPYLQAGWDRAAERAEYVFPEYRTKTDAYLRKRFNEIARRAGLGTIKSPFRSMRSSRETELIHAYGMELASKWIGNTPAIARRHYFQVRTEDMQKAATAPTGNLPVLVPNPVPAMPGQKHKEAHTHDDNPHSKPVEASTGSEVLVDEGLMTPTGFEPVLPA